MLLFNNVDGEKKKKKSPIKLYIQFFFQIELLSTHILIYKFKTKQLQILNMNIFFVMFSSLMRPQE